VEPFEPLGGGGRPLDIICDSSKPLHANVENFTGDKTDSGVRRARMQGHKGPLGWKLARPVRFGDSRDHPAIQLADVLAGTAVAFAAGTLPEGSETIIESMVRHGLPDSIWPNLDIVKPENREAAVNALILYDLAKKAEQGSDPHENLALMYHLAEVRWAKGEFQLGRRL
jgi:hypothetical protein